MTHEKIIPQTKERYLLVMQSKSGQYFLSGKYFQINEKLPINLEKHYPDSRFIKVAEWSKEIFIPKLIAAESEAL